jgi:uncharacterized protein (DUF1697 family)
VRTYVALLRAINLGARNKIPMGDLKALFADLGHEDVATYVQSGNVVFRTRTGTESRVVAEIEQRITKEFGHDVAVLLRTPAELAKIAKGNPFLKGETDHKKLHVMFLDRRPAAKSVAGLDPDRSPPDAFEVSGRNIYLHFPTRGSGRSKLTIGYFEGRLDVRGTARNWRTVTTLADLASQADGSSK